MWDVDSVQFARILDEINAIGLTDEQMKSLSESMGFNREQIKSVLDRATKKWDKMKPMLSQKLPLSEEQLSEQLAEHGKVSGIITMDFGEIVGQLSEEQFEDVLEEFTDRITNGAVALEEIDYKVIFSEDDVLYIEVKGTAVNEDEEAN